MKSTDLLAQRGTPPGALGRMLIWGAGGHAKVVAELARLCGYEVKGHVDIDAGRVGEQAEPGGARVVMDERSFNQLLDDPKRDFDALAVGIGKNAARLAALELFHNVVDLPVLVHPSAVLSSSCVLGAGSVVFANVVVNAAASIGMGAILNSACVVEHDCRLDDGVHISPNATLAGAVSVGRLSWVGAGATVIEKVRIGERVTVGAGAVVLSEVSDGLTVVGCPAKALPSAR